MPVESLPTGVELYYESHGQGEPLILIPATGFSGDVWLAHQVPVLSKSLNVILHDPSRVRKNDFSCFDGLT